MSTYDKYKTKRVTITLGEIPNKKIKSIAKNNGYNNAADLYREIITAYIKNYESINGEISIESDENKSM